MPEKKDLMKQIIAALEDQKKIIENLQKTVMRSFKLAFGLEDEE